MIFSINKEQFLKICRLAAIVAAEKKIGTNICSSHVLWSVKDHALRVVATDLDLELIVQEFLPVVEQEGSAVVPFRKIGEICRAMTENVELRVFVSQEAVAKLNIESTQGFFSISIINYQEFPVLSEKAFHSSFFIDMKVLQELINKTAFAMGEDDNRQFLNGVFLHFSPQEILSVATDGHRLVVWEATKDPAEIQEYITDLTTEIKILLPRKSVFDLVKIFGETVEHKKAKVSLGENHIRIAFNNIIFTSKLLSAKFPAYQRLIPIKLQNQLIASREQLKSSFLRAVALLGDRSKGVKLIFGKDQLQITARNDSDDLVQENLSVHYDGPPITIGFNVKYLLDFLSSIDGEKVLLKIESATKGALIQDLALKSSYVLMPMQI